MPDKKFVLIVGYLLAFFTLTLTHLCAHEAACDLHHWEIATQDPDRLILTFNGNPANSRAVSWRTAATVIKPVAQIALATDNNKFENSKQTIHAKTEAVNLGLYGNNQAISVHYHSVTFDRLLPDTLYAYRVGEINGKWSEWVHFRTAKQGYAPTQFVFFGDAQNNVLSHWSRVIRMAYQTAPEASFAIHAGDLINLAHRDTEWAEWYQAGGFIHRQWTAIPVVGNHEVMPKIQGAKSELSIQWRPQFTLPVEPKLPPELHETVYTIDYQSVRIIVLNSQQSKEDQTQYLEKQLKESNAKWNIIVCHHSIFSPAQGRDFSFGRVHWKPLIHKYGVDLVLNGHDHTYARGHVPVNYQENTRKDELGTVYVTSVSGPKQYKLNKDHLKTYTEEGYQADCYGENTQFYQVINILDDTLTYIAYTATGQEHDRFVITKDFNSGKKNLK